MELLWNGKRLSNFKPTECDPWASHDPRDEVTDDEVAAAMRLYFSATHSTAEGAGAAPLAAASQEAARNRGKRIAVVLSGGNVDRDMFARVLAG